MNPNLSHSFEEKNQFMPNQQRGGDPKFEYFLQGCLDNPSFYQIMKKFYVQQTGQAPPQPKYTNNDDSELQSYISNSSQANPIKHQANRQPNYEEDVSIDDHFNEEPVKRLAANPLLKYQPQPVAQTMGKKPCGQEFATNSLEQKPIKSKFVQNLSSGSSKQSTDLNSIKENQSINIDIQERPSKPSRNLDEQPAKGIPSNGLQNKYREFEERPIKSMSRSEQEQYYQEPINNNKTSTKSIAMTSTSQINRNSDLDERPLTGAKKDFKQLIKEQFPEPFREDPQEEQEEERRIEPRNFLKRGSRQHLSSAVTRSKQPKKQEDLDKSGLDKSRDLTPKNQKADIRSTSQNRVLGKKNTAEINDKSINKGIAKNDESQMLVSQMPKSKPPLQTNQPNLKGKVSISNTNKPKVIEPASKKKKTRNVFDDNSQESSSSSEDEPFFKAASKKVNEVSEIENEDKIQVIDRVYLTNQQLQEILKRYGKAQVERETESEKNQAIRSKYTELCQLVESERETQQAELEKEKIQFEKYRAEQLQKIKGERRVMERQLKAGTSIPNLQKEREELENAKQELQKQRQDSKKRDRNNKIIIDKLKKENEELKAKIERLEMEREQLTNKKSFNSKAEYNLDEKVTIPSIPKVNKSRVEEAPKQEISYKDIKKGKDSKQPAKLKYEYTEEQPVSKNKITNVQKQKIQDKWASNRFANNSEDDSESEGEEAKLESSDVAEWGPATKLSDLTKVDLSIKMVNDKIITALFKHQNNVQYKKYIQTVNSPSRTIVNTTRNARNNYVANLYSDRSKQLVYDNGTRKQTLENGYTIVYFKNGDIKQTLSDRTVLYYFKQKEVDQITLPNGINIYRFENNQVEFHFTNGYIEIRHPEGTIKVLGQHNRR